MKINPLLKYFNTAMALVCLLCLEELRRQNLTPAYRFDLQIVLLIGISVIAIPVLIRLAIDPDARQRFSFAYRANAEEIRREQQQKAAANPARAKLNYFAGVALLGFLFWMPGGGLVLGFFVNYTHIRGWEPLAFSAIGGAVIAISVVRLAIRP